MTLEELEQHCAEAERQNGSPAGAMMVVTVPAKRNVRYWPGKRVRVARGLEGRVCGDTRGGERIYLGLRCTAVRKLIARLRKDGEGGWEVIGKTPTSDDRRDRKVQSAGTDG